jgi:hypothetical protein
VNIKQLRRCGVRFAALALAGVLAGCAWPTSDESTLKAIAAECQHLMQTEPPDTDNGPVPTYSGVPRSRWPRVIASLNPVDVVVFRQGCDVLIKPMFDGGWGYFVPRTKGRLPEPRERYSDEGYGVYWFHPY